MKKNKVLLVLILSREKISFLIDFRLCQDNSIGNVSMDQTLSDSPSKNITNTNMNSKDLKKVFY